MAFGATIQNGYAQGGPPGGTVFALAIDPSTPATLYAGTYGAGVFKSTSGGTSWTAVNAGLANANVYTLAIDPSTPATLYVGPGGGGVFKSTNGGASWTSVGLANNVVRALAIDPSTPATLYAGTSGGGVFKSTNGGTSWTSVGLTNTLVWALAIDPSTPATLYAGTEKTAGSIGGGDVFKSTDGGTSWTSVWSGWPDRGSAPVTGIAIDPSTPSTIYAGTEGQGVLKSTNGGTTWAAVNSGLPDPNTVTYALMVFSLAINPATPATLYVGTFNGLFKSTNGGTTWTALSNGLPDPTRYGYGINKFALAVDPSNPDTLYTGSCYYGVGVFKSTDGGASWTTANSGLGNTAVQAVAIDPSTPATLYVGPDGGGVFKTTNGGNSWTAANAGLGKAIVYSLAIDPSTPATLYAGTDKSGIFKSTNGASSWTAVNAGLTATLRVFYALAIDPLSPATLYAGGVDGVFKSTNGGTSWTIATFGARALAIDPSTPSTVYAGTGGGGVYKSTNGGTTWIAANGRSSVSSPRVDNTSIYTLSIDPTSPATLYAGANDYSWNSYSGGFKSTNGGKWWTRTGTLGGVLAFAIDPSTPSTLYAGGDHGVFKSTNGGTNWTVFNSGLTSSNILTLTIDPVTPATLYAGTSGGGVFKSTNGGANWQPTGAGMSPPSPPSIPEITTQPVSVFRRAGENATFSVAANGQPPLRYQWHNGTGILPNATNSSLTITNAQADARYYVVVSNSYGSVTSQGAQLKILVDYNTAILTPIAPTPPPPPPKPPSQHNLVVVTHGWDFVGTSDFSTDAPQWVYDMTKSIGSHLPDASWTVFALSWNGLSGATTVYPGGAASRAENIGKKFGLGISSQGWSHVHFIGFSAGAVLIQSAAETLRANSASPVVIHTTFLDPYDWSFFGGPSRFGAVSDWSDHYFESDITGPLTGGRMDHSYNVNISGLDPHTFGAHEWAYEFYQKTITGDLGSSSEGLGFPLSKEIEGSNWDYASIFYPPGNSPYLLGGGPGLVSSSGVPIQSNPNLAVDALSALWYGTVYLAYNGFDLFTSLVSPIKLKDWSTNTFGSPGWLSLGITVTNRVNFVRFDARFTSATNSAGLLSVYWNTNEIGVADETVTTPGLQHYSFALPVTYSSGNYVLGFRLDSFENIVSSISITNISLGFAGLTNPITLGISRASGSNQLTLNGPPNYNYLVQSSSNLVDWIPAAIVANTNGTALFSDPAATNYSRRFYRAISP